MESQERRNRQDAEVKVERAVERATSKAAAAARREEKRIEPRKDDVSQLADIMRLSSPIRNDSE